MNHFIIVGSGWRALFFVRIAKAMPQQFTLDAMLCRTVEKAEKMARENDIYTTTDVEECIELKPDFVVVAVSKPNIANVSMEWMDRGFTVLAETPAGIDYDSLEQLRAREARGQKLVTAEQYTRYANHKARIAEIRKGTIGEPMYLYLSCAHEYHAASLMRAYLGVDSSEKYTVSTNTFEFPSVETYNRYDHFTDGRIAHKKRTVAVIKFESGKVCVYDFDSDQYHSSIRKNLIKIQGVRGEIINDIIYYLDENNLDARITLEIPHSANGLNEDENAIAELMLGTAEYAKGTAQAPYKLCDSIADAILGMEIVKG